MSTAIANVYHFYRDLLINFGNLIDFTCGNIFNKIEYNIQDRTFLLKDYDGSLRLPSLYLQCSSLINRLEYNNPLTHQIQSYGPNDTHNIPLLYNETKDDAIIATCQYNQLTIDITINAASSLEILDITQYLNQTFPQNLIFNWSLNILLPVPDFLLDGWEIGADSIYYLYEQTLTTTQNDKIIDKQIYYALFELTPLVQVSASSMSTPMSYQTTQTVNMTFTINTFVPTILYRKSNPKDIAKVVYTFGTTNEPISSITRDLIDNIEEKTDYKFYIGAIIDKNHLTYDSDTYTYYITITNSTIANNIDNYVFVLYFYPEESYISTINYTIEVDNVDTTTGTITYKIDKSKLTDYQQSMLDKVLNDELSLDAAFFTKES